MLYTTAQTAQFWQHERRYLLADLTDHVLTLTLNRPDKKNALNPTLLHELAFALTYARHEPTVWVVVLAATGDTFCAGMDLRALTQPNVVESAVPAPAGAVRLGELMAELHKPCVVRVQGPVWAGGFLLVGGAHYVVATDTATFGLPEVKRGLFPFQVLAVLLDIMPARLALDWCLRARTLSATDAQATGLVTHVVAPDEVDNVVANVVNELKQGSPTALQFGLRAYQQLKRLPRSEQQAFLHEQFGQIQQTADAQEGMAAFLEKRAPNWIGQ